MSGLGTIAEFVTAFLIVLGALFALIGSWGLVRLPTLMERLHGPTKATTLGVGAMLVGSMVFFRLERGEWSGQELLISLFLFITAPIAANMMAKVHLHRLRLSDDAISPGQAGVPPEPDGKAGWSTYDAPQPDTPVATSRK